MLGRSIGIVAASLVAGPALAHHPMGGKTPSTALEGILSGLAHPVIGPDHFAFVIGIGILSAFVRRGWILPVVFLCLGAFGTAIHLAGAGVPGAETLVAVTVLLMAGAVLLSRRVPVALLAALCGLGGLAHGYALAESIAGAEPSPLASYLAGLVTVQLAISFLVREAALHVAGSHPGVASRAALAASAAMLLVGVAALPLWPA